MFITAAEIRKLTAFGDVQKLTDEQITGYMDRADSWIRRSTNREFTNEDPEIVKQDIRIATWLLVDYLVYWDNPEVKETMMGPDSSVNLGSFQVEYKNLSTWRNAVPGEETGIKELDSILNRYRFNPSAAGFFHVLRKGDR